MSLPGGSMDPGASLERSVHSFGPLVESVVASLGMVLFALFAHTRGAGLVLAGFGLIATAGALAHGLAGSPSTLRLLAIARPKRKSIVILPVALGTWVLLAAVYRSFLGVAVLPQGLRRFALSGVLIGATEELLYRGFVQTRLRPRGKQVAIVGAAFAHTGYKVALFLAFSSEVNVFLLGVSTFLGGILLGTLRELAGDVTPAVVGHAAFDLVVYGDHWTAPWWVW